jgi:plastocyanin
MTWLTRFQGAMLIGAVALFAMHAGAAEAGGGGCHSQAITTGAGVAVDMRQSCFEPTVLTIRTGERVTWTNRDAGPHTVTGAANGWGNFEAVQQGQTISFDFDEPGVYPYVCWLHPTMLGAVVVDSESGSLDVSALVTPETVEEPEPALVEVKQRDGGVPAALALGGVALGVAAGLGSAAGWRRLRTGSAGGGSTVTLSH